MKHSSNKITEKEELRAWAKEVRSKLGPSKLRQISLEIVRRIRNLDYYKNASTVMSYLAKNIEINLEELFSDGGKYWYLPVVIKKDSSLNVVPYLHRKTKLVQGMFGIQEPEINDGLCFNQKDKMINLDIIFVPGLCFDHLGNRIGFGKGYYDQFLKLNPDSFKIGCCPKGCFVEALPTDLWDEKVDLVITD